MLACRSLASQNVNDYERSIKYRRMPIFETKRKLNFSSSIGVFSENGLRPLPPFLPVYALVLKMAFRLEREKCKELVTTRQPWLMNRVGETVSQRTIENLF